MVSYFSRIMIGLSGLILIGSTWQIAFAAETLENTSQATTLQAQHSTKSSHHSSHQKGKHRHKCPSSKKSSHRPAHHTKPSKVNINKAKQHTLTRNTGLNVAQAEALITYRQQYGKFTSVDDLSKVELIGAEYVAQHREELEKAFSFN